MFGCTVFDKTEKSDCFISKPIQNLKKGKYNPDHKTKHELKTVFLKFFRNSSKKESTYKYVMMQTILERCNENEKKVSF